MTDVPLVAGALEPANVGDVLPWTTTDSEARPIVIPARIMREATLAEFARSIAARGLDMPTQHDLTKCWFYEVSID